MNWTIDTARYFKKTENCWDEVATSQGFCKMQLAMPSIMATKRKHIKNKVAYLQVSEYLSAVPDITDSSLMDGEYYR